MLNAIEPTITEFLEAMDDLRDNYQFKTDRNLRATTEEMEASINELMAAITERFENFERGTKHMWDEISAERFHKVEQLISSYHTPPLAGCCVRSASKWKPGPDCSQPHRPAAPANGPNSSCRK